MVEEASIKTTLLMLDLFCHLCQTSIEVIGKNEWFYTSKMHEKSHMILVQYRKSSLRGELLHDDLHERCLVLKGVPKRKKLLRVLLMMFFEIGLIVLKG